MPLTSDITINAANFHPDNATLETRAICDLYEKATSSKPRWYEVGAPRYREMIENGEIEGLKPGLLSLTSLPRIRQEERENEITG
jgi:hypothetical protein